MLKKSSRSRRVHRRFAPVFTAGFGPVFLEARKLAAPFFYRTSAQPVTATIVEIDGGGITEDDEMVTAVAISGDSGSNNENNPGGPGWAWSETESVENSVDDAGLSSTGSGFVSVTVNHNDQGSTWFYESGPPTMGAEANPYSVATSGYDHNTGVILPLTWNIQQDASATTPLPANQEVETIFSAQFAANNAQNMISPLAATYPVGLTLVSTFLDVDINDAVSPQGITITDAATGTVLWRDLHFGTDAAADSARADIITPLTAVGANPNSMPTAFPVFLEYVSVLQSPLDYADEGDPNDHTWHQDQFTWTISFNPYQQT